MEKPNYPGFPYTANQLSAYLLSMDTFIISLSTNQVVTFVPQDSRSFKEWLQKNRIRNIAEAPDPEK